MLSFEASAQPLIQKNITDDPTPISYLIGDERLLIPANCIIDIPPFLEAQKWTEEEHTIRFFWPGLTCLSRDRLEDFNDPTTPDLIRVLTSGVNSRSVELTPTFGVFIGTVEGVTRWTYDEATFELDHDEQLDMYVRHTNFLDDKKIALYVDRDHDLRSITRFLYCGQEDWYCYWRGQFCGLDVEIDFNRTQLPNAKAIYDDAERLFCERWRGERG